MQSGWCRWQWRRPRCTTQFQLERIRRAMHPRACAESECRCRDRKALVVDWHQFRGAHLSQLSPHRVPPRDDLPQHHAVAEYVCKGARELCTVSAVSASRSSLCMAQWPCAAQKTVAQAQLAALQQAAIGCYRWNNCARHEGGIRQAASPTLRVHLAPISSSGAAYAN